VSRNIIRYYDSNTPRFLRFGQGAESAAIHRAVWAEGVASRRQAMEYVNTLVEEAIRETNGRRVLDIGCGIGGSLAFLAGRIQAQFCGLTISAVQGEIGRRFLRDRGCGDRCSILVGDFTEDGWLRELEAEDVRGSESAAGFKSFKSFKSFKNGGKFDTAFAIESFLHMRDPESFFKRAAECLREGGQLLICDDFLAEEYRGEALPPGIDRLVGRFRRGWQVQTLMSVQETVDTARREGFTCIEERDLSPCLELRRPRDRVIRLMMAIGGSLPIRTPFWQNMSGGDALQTLLLKGIVQYHCIRFVKRTD